MGKNPINPLTEESDKTIVERSDAFGRKILAEGKYVRFVETLESSLDLESKKTKSYEVITKETFIESGCLPRPEPLGMIKWFGRWHQYAFFPEQQTAYDARCLSDIQKFIESLMTQRRKSSK